MMTTSSAKFALIRKPAIAGYATVSLILAAVIIAFSLAPAYNILYYFNPLTVVNEVEYSINRVPQGTIQLPSTISGLEPGDEVSVFLKSRGNEQDNLLIEVNNAKCMLIINGDPYFTVGDQGTFPAFQKEPPRSIDIVALPSVKAGSELQLTYTISAIGSSLALQPYVSGDQNLITKRVVLENYLALILSLFMLIAGVAISIIGLVFYSRAELAIVLFWLGLTCLVCGCWTLFANDIVLLFFSQFSAFYTISLISLLFIPIPLGMFCIHFVQPYRSKILNCIYVSLCVFFAAAMISHLAGFISFGQVAPAFSIIGSLLLVSYIFFANHARRLFETSISLLFIVGMALFAALSLLDALSNFLGILKPVGLFFTVGLSFAAIVIVLLVWEYLNDAFDALEKNARLESDISSINRSLDLQRKHFEEFALSAEETRRMRHDLRHQLVALQGFISEQKDKEALEYIDHLSASIPSFSESSICDNVAVNSLAVHYIAQAEELGILCDVKMAVPLVVGRIPDGDLSILVGNLFENAIEACQYVEPEKRFIKIRSIVVANRFTFIIDNSYDGKLNVSGTDFYSRKRKGFGVGIASVRSVVSKYDGSIKYETESGVFKTSLYVKT